MIEKTVHTAKQTVKANVDSESALAALTCGRDVDLSGSVIFLLRGRRGGGRAVAETKKTAGQVGRARESGARLNLIGGFA
jgi:hypothetical protein